MKNILIFAIILSLILALAACGDDTSETPTPSDTPDSTEQSKRISDEEVYSLAMTKADELYRLFQEFLIYHRLDLPLPFDEETVLGEYIEEDGEVFIFSFYMVNHDTIKTYDDLYNIFLEVCTPEYSTYLLKKASHYFTDIDDRLAFYETMFTRGPEECDEVLFIGFEITGDDEIKLFFSADMYVNLGDEGIINDGPPREYTITLTNIDGKWLISDCTNLNVHGHFGNLLVKS
jgi:hypothetical protein